MCGDSHFQLRRREILLYIALLGLIGRLCLFASDYLQTRSEARLAVSLAHLGPGIPWNGYIAEWGEPERHLRDPNEMKSWGPSTDETLLGTTELYYFWFSGVPCRYIVVYVDENTRRSVMVTWKGMQAPSAHAVRIPALVRRCYARRRETVEPSDPRGNRVCFRGHDGHGIIVRPLHARP